MTSRWAEMDDEAPPPPPKVEWDPSGSFKLVTTYSVDRIGNKKKTVEKVLVSKEVRRIPIRVLERKKVMKPFGSALLALSPSGEQENVTIVSKDEVKIEHPKSSDPNAAEGEGDIDPTKALFGGGSAQINAFWAKQQRRQLERKYDVEGGGEGGDSGSAPPTGGDDGKGGDAAAGGKYVPPSLRGAMGLGGSGKTLEQRAEMAGERGPGGRDDDLQQMNTIRVTNISEETTESDLSDLFTPFGRISRVYLAKDKETLQSRGFAFISFVHHDDAKNAMAKLQGFGYDHLILKLEWARPGGSGGGMGGGGGERTEFRSGYGKALAQDTKEKVSFASNLTK